MQPILLAILFANNPRSYNLITGERAKSNKITGFKAPADMTHPNGFKEC